MKYFVQMQENIANQQNFDSLRLSIIAIYLIEDNLLCNRQIFRAQLTWIKLVMHWIRNSFDKVSYPIKAIQLLRNF